MKKKVFVAVATMLCPALLWAQFRIHGKVAEPNNQVLSGASIKLKNKKAVAISGANGEYLFDNLPAGNYVLRVSFVGFEAQEKKVDLKADHQIDFVLTPLSLMADEVVVRATRADKNGASTYRNMDKKEIAKYNHGQDFPYLLNQTPSVVVSSDAGTGIGYTGIRIRGSDATRINVTLNGIPLNDAESQGSYFVDLPDFASSVDNVQIQRGVGTSTNGAGAFGASINIQTTTRKDTAYAELNNTFGSFNTWKNTVNVGSGLVNNHFTVDARLSRIKSDGYVNPSFSNLKSFFVTGAYYGKNDILRANVFSGHEKTYQAWNGIYEETLKTNRRFNANTYDNQTDNYQQDHYQLLYSRNLNKQLVANAALHYTYGRGYYEEYKDNQKLSKYNIPAVTATSPTTNNSDLVRQLWLDNDFYGATYSLIYTPQSEINITLGGAYNQYKGRHFKQVVWAKFANYDAGKSLKHIYDDNDAFKSDFNIFGRVSYQLDKLNIAADLQYRNVFYSFFGFDDQQKRAQQNARIQLFNPKFGLSYQINTQNNVYASVAVGHKEPNRNDFVNSTDKSRPKSESLVDFETGYRLQKKTINVGLNGYAMLYKNQLVNTGQINDVGSATRQNVLQSYRIGLELDGRWQILKTLYWQATLAFSQSKIKDFTEYIYSETGTGMQSNAYRNTDISYSPGVVASNEISFNPLKNTEIALLTKYVGRQYLDNTQSESRKLAAFFVNDIRLGYHFAFVGVKNIGLNLLINNVFNKKYESHGYVYQYLENNQASRFNYYYPQATTNFLLSLQLKF